MNYKTTETTEAILFKTFNYPYIDKRKISRPNGKEAVEFEFDIPSIDIVQAIMKDYYNHTLEVDAYDHDEAMKFIRKEIYDTN